MTKTEELAKKIVEVLEASGLGPDEQIKALGRARTEVCRPYHQPVKFTGPITKPGKNRKERER